MVHLSPGLRASEPYPFEELDRRKAEAIADGRPIVDFGVGDPREETPAFIRAGPEGRDRADLLVPARRRPPRAPRAPSPPGSSGASATALDPDVHILPTLGSKEPIFSLAQAVLDPRGRASTW